MDKVNIHEAKTHFSKLVERVHNGEEIIVAKTGVPYARLVPLEKKKPRAPGLWKGRSGSALLEPLPEEERSLWEA